MRFISFDVSRDDRYVHSWIFLDCFCFSFGNRIIYLIIKREARKRAIVNPFDQTIRWMEKLFFYRALYIRRSRGKAVARVIVGGIEIYNLNACVWPCHSFNRSPLQSGTACAYAHEGRMSTRDTRGVKLLSYCVCYAAVLFQTALLEIPIKQRWR